MSPVESEMSVASSVSGFVELHQDDTNTEARTTFKNEMDELKRMLKETKDVLAQILRDRDELKNEIEGLKREVATATTLDQGMKELKDENKKMTVTLAGTCKEVNECVDFIQGSELEEAADEDKVREMEKVYDTAKLTATVAEAVKCLTEVNQRGDAQGDKLRKDIEDLVAKKMEHAIGRLNDVVQTASTKKKKDHTDEDMDQVMRKKCAEYLCSGMRQGYYTNEYAKEIADIAVCSIKGQRSPVEVAFSLVVDQKAQDWNGLPYHIFVTICDALESKTKA